MSLQTQIRDQIELIKTINRDFNATAYEAAEAELARLVSAMDDVAIANGTVGAGAASAVTVNAEAGIISFSASLTDTVVQDTGFPFVLNNSYITATTPVIFSPYVDAAVDAIPLSCSVTKTTGSATVYLLSTTATAVAVSAVAIDFHVITERT